MFKACKICTIQLNEDNAAKGPRNTFRRLCRPCRSKQVMDYQNKNRPARRNYVNNWARQIGKVKQYECLTCKALCYKKYALAFCSDECRFMHYVNKTSSCWLWVGPKNKGGYGKLCFRGNKTATSHRVAYELFKGKIDEGFLVCHKCDNPPCVNPDHLFLGTIADNKEDQLQKDRGGVKLKAKDVIKIRKLYENDIGSALIARLFNVTCGTISSIAKRRIWKHI